ncbi:hypothetical protein OROGR_021296 [Orobanche gracilis]
MVRGFVSWCLRHSPAQRRPPPRLLRNLRGNERQAEEGSTSVAQLNYVIVLSVNHAVQHEEMVCGFVSWSLRHSPAQRRPPPRMLGNLRGTSESQPKGSDSVAQLKSVINGEWNVAAILISKGRLLKLDESGVRCFRD